MKTKPWIVFFGIMLTITFCGCLAENQNNTIEMGDKAFSVNGSTFIFNAEEDEKNGLVWEYHLSQTGYLQEISNQTNYPLSDELPQHQWKFKGKKTGTVELTFEYINQSTGLPVGKMICLIQINIDRSLTILHVKAADDETRHVETYGTSERVYISENQNEITFQLDSIVASGYSWKWETTPTDLHLDMKRHEENTNGLWPQHSVTIVTFEGFLPGETELVFTYSNGDTVAKRTTYIIQTNMLKNVHIKTADYEQVNKVNFEYPQK